MVADLVADVDLDDKEIEQPLIIENVPIDEFCTGSRWAVQNEEELARLIAIIAMGQAAFVIHIIQELKPAAPAFTNKQLCDEARIRLTVQEDNEEPRKGYPREQRDGFIFEAISWISARQAHGKNALLKAPHVSSTSQGLDGLMIEVSDDKSKVIKTTIFEDKCTDIPRKVFREKVMRDFIKRHENKRSVELVASASSLLFEVVYDWAAAARLSSAVMNPNERCYRAAFALPISYDSEEQRKKLFKGFEKLENITPDQRIGAGLIVDGKLRDWFDQLAIQSIKYLNQLEGDTSNV